MEQRRDAFAGGGSGFAPPSHGQSSADGSGRQSPGTSSPSGSARLSGDDRDQFVALIPLHMGAMLRLAAALIGIVDAEDAAQEAVLRAWQAWPMLRDRAAARTWLLSITVNLCKDWHRGRYGTRHRRDEPLRDDRDYAAYDAGGAVALIGSDPGASDAAAALDLRQAINTLDVDARVLIALRHYAGMDSSEIGALLGIPPATVRTRLRRALAALRERLRGPQSPGHTPYSSYTEGGR
jgi:RNA polymerase sigma-70 factor (ECF subfamily)